jgi:hypothetical protein
MYMPNFINRYFLTWLLAGLGLGALIGRVVPGWVSVFWVVAVGAACVIWWRALASDAESDSFFADDEADIDLPEEGPSLPPTIE